MGRTKQVKRYVLCVGIDPGQDEAGVASLLKDRQRDDAPIIYSVTSKKIGRRWPNYRSAITQILPRLLPEDIEIRICYEYVGRFARVAFGAGLMIWAICEAIARRWPIASPTPRPHEMRPFVKGVSPGTWRKTIMNHVAPSHRIQPGEDPKAWALRAVKGMSNRMTVEPESDHEAEAVLITLHTLWGWA